MIADEGGVLSRTSKHRSDTEAKSLVACWSANTMRVTDDECVAQLSSAWAAKFPWRRRGGDITSVREALERADSVQEVEAT